MLKTNSLTFEIICTTECLSSFGTALQNIRAFHYKEFAGSGANFVEEDDWRPSFWLEEGDNRRLPEGGSAGLAALIA